MIDELYRKLSHAEVIGRIHEECPIKLQGLSNDLLEEARALKEWRSRIDELLIDAALDPDVFEYESHLLDRPGKQDEEDGFDSATSQFTDFRHELDECDCDSEAGQVCIHCCTKLDLEAFPKCPEIKAVNRRSSHVGEIFDIVMSEEVAERLGLFAAA